LLAFESFGKGLAPVSPRLAPPRATGPSPPAGGRPSSYPSSSSPPPAEVAGRSPGDAGGGGSSFPASWLVGQGPLLPWRRCTSGSFGPAISGDSGGGAVLWRRGSAAGLRRRLAPSLGAPALDGLGQAQMGSSGPGSARLTGGGGDAVTGSGTAVCGQHIAAWRPELYGPFWVRPGQSGPGVLQLLCPVNDCLSAVEVGSSRLAARLLFLAPTMSCASAI
jgi:hypothetical protein